MAIDGRKPEAQRTDATQIACFPASLQKAKKPTISPLPPGAGQLEKREGIALVSLFSLLALAPGGRGATISHNKKMI
jgi:hypothetical protein